MPEAGSTTILPLEARGIGKRFGGTVALRGVDLSVAAGECLAIVGENGAGKSTLMKILAGVEQPDTGVVALAGRPTSISSPAHARALGICLIHQDLQSVPAMTVVQNIFLGREQSRHGLIRQGAADDAARRTLRKLGLDISLRRQMRTLSVAEAQLVEIAKGLSQDADVVIMDEPTAALAPVEVDRLFAVIRGLVALDKAVLYISHRIDEIGLIASRVVVLRDGAVVGELPASAERRRVVSLMVGREIRDLYPRTPHTPGNVLLEVVGLSARGVRDVSFQVRSGEIVGVGGLVGAGQHELADALYGRVPLESGEIRIQGQSCRALSPARAMARGIALVTQDRRREGLNLKANLQDNIALPVLARLSRAGLLNLRAVARLAAEAMGQFRIRAASPLQRVTELSGGNQQKVVLARAMARNPSVLILDEPTRGVDVGAKVDIYELLGRLATEGKGIVMISSDLAELRGMSDRILVMYRGGVAGELAGNESTPEAVGLLATGQGLAVA